MAAEVKVPRLGQGRATGRVFKWLKARGDRFEKGEPLFELDTDKVTQEVEAEAAGVLLKIAVPEGEVPVGETVAFIGEQGEDVPEVAAAAPPPRSEAPSTASNSLLQAKEEPVPAAPASGNGRIKASPLARRLARERGIDLATLHGTGPEGRIVAEDVERAEAGAATAPPAGTRPVQAPVPAGGVERV